MVHVRAKRLVFGVTGMTCICVLYVYVRQGHQTNVPGQNISPIISIFTGLKNNSITTQRPVPIGYVYSDLMLKERFAPVLKMVEEIEESDTSTQWIREHLSEVGSWNCTGSPHIYNGVENLLCMKPPKFLPQYKNPCWIQAGTQELSCLPYFQIIGMDKSGSTDLFDKIAKHPCVLPNSGIIEKETQWWSWRRYGHFLKRKVKIETFSAYLKYFDKAAESIELRSNDSLITGDGTPMDVWDMSEWDLIPQNDVNLREPTFTTSDLIRHVNPYVKLLLILRNPVDRVFSDYFFLGLGKMSLKGFHEQVIHSIHLLHECTRKDSLRSCLYSRPLLKAITARIHLGFYSLFLKDWIRVFPRDQFFIVRTEDYSLMPQETLRQAFSFLGLSSLSDEEMEKMTASEKRHVTKRKKKMGDMLPETRMILERLYFRFNAELSDMLQDKSYLWQNSTQTKHS